MIIILVITFLSIILTGCTSFSHSVKTPDLSEQIDLLLNAQAEKPFNGIILIAQNDTIIYSKVCGYCDIENEIPMKIENQFVVGSISKQFTAAIVLQEYDKNCMSLHFPIKK